MYNSYTRLSAALGIGNHRQTTSLSSVKGATEMGQPLMSRRRLRWALLECSAVRWGTVVQFECHFHFRPPLAADDPHPEVPRGRPRSSAALSATVSGPFALRRLKPVKMAI